MCGILNSEIYKDMQKFKATICADPHITFSAYGRIGKDGINFRTADFMNAFSWSVDRAIESGSTHFIVLGDLFESPNPQNNIRRFLNTKLTALSEAGVKTRLLAGNHDFCKLHHALEAMIGLNLHNIKIIEKPECEKIDDPDHPVYIMYFPHHMAVERGEVSLRDAFADFCNKNRAAVREVKDEKGTSLLFGHFGVFGAKMNDGQSNGDYRSVTCEELDRSPADYVFLGDYHTHQILPTKKVKSMFCGSLERTNSKDILSEKGYVLFDLDHINEEDYGKARFIPYPGVRPFIEISGSPAEVEGKIKAGVPSGAIVKVICSGMESEIKEYRKLKQDLAAKLELDGAEYVDWSEMMSPDPEQQKKIDVLRAEIESRSTIDASDLQDILFSRVDINYPDEVERQAIKDEISDIIKYVNAKRKR